jgi:transposase
MAKREELTNKQWATLEPLIPKVVPRADGRSRPPTHSDRAVLNGILWRHVLGQFAGAVTLQLDLLLTLQSLGAPGGIARDRASPGAGLGGSGQDQSLGMLYRRHLRGGEKEGLALGETKRGRGKKLMVITDAAGLPLAMQTASASPHGVPLVEATLDRTLTLGKPRRLIGDRAYDSDPLDLWLGAQDIELIAPHKRHRIKPVTQDAHPLRRYRRRWKIKRLFAWLNKYKRVLIRWGRFIDHFNANVHLACSMILMRKY